MSLSNQKAESSFKYGKILLGTSSEGPTVVPLAELEGGSERLTWTQANTEDYKRRVRDKAAAMAKSILLEAQREARELKAQAKTEGHREGRELARRELELAREEMAVTLTGYLAAFQSGRGNLWNTQRQDIVTLIQLAVEKAVHLEMSSRNREILENLLDQAVDALDSRQRLIVRVHPGDEDNMLNLLRRARERHPDLGSWRVKTDPALHAGGLLLESDHGLVDNSVETRLAWIREVLDHLTFADVEPPAALASMEAAGILPEKLSEDLPLPSVDPVEAALDAASGEIQIQAQAEAAEQAASAPEAEEEAPVATAPDATAGAAAESEAAKTPLNGQSAVDDLFDAQAAAGETSEDSEAEAAPKPQTAPVHLTDQDAVDNFFESHADTVPAATEDTPEAPETAEATEAESPPAAEDNEVEAAPESQGPPVHLQDQDAVDNFFESQADAAPAEASPETSPDAPEDTPKAAPAAEDNEENDRGSLLGPDFTQVPLDGQGAVDDLFEAQAAKTKAPLDGQNAVDDLFEAQAAKTKTSDDTDAEEN